MVRARQIIESATPELRRDNPRGEWLADEIATCNAAGRGRYGEPRRFGNITAWFTGNVVLPVRLVAGVRGLMGEHTFTRQHSYDWLYNYMSKHGKLPTDGAPFIMVAHDGSAWMNEGNHRVKVAKALGWDSIPIELRYYSGGELVDGPWSPDKVLAAAATVRPDVV